MRERNPLPLYWDKIMIGDQRDNTPVLCSVEEFLYLTRFETTGHMGIANRIFNSYAEHHKINGFFEIYPDCEWQKACCVSAVYDAGYIQGIRAERQRRKAGFRAIYDKLRRAIYSSDYAEAFDIVRSVMRDIEQRL